MVNIMNILKHVFTVQVLLFFIAIVFLTAVVPAAQATVEKDWPVTQPNTCRAADDFSIDFEAGIEGIQIESTIPNLKFTTTSGLNWTYGDIRTGLYNIYPYGTQAYETRGNFFAWLGVTGDEGRIDFPGGGATYVSALVSTSSGLTIDAYNDKDVLIATSGSAGSNTNTRTFTRLTVDAPAGDDISYVIIHDTGNFWLIDELCTNANKAIPPVPGRTTGSHSDRFDIVFIPDNDYGLPADTDTWLPTFLDHINHQIDERLGGAAPVSGNLDRFNFYYTKMQGTASSKTLPADLTQLSTFADAYVIFHNTVFGDSTSWGPPPIYGAEGPVGRSFIHESGHGIFGLADEYDGCGTYYFQPDPMPNIWATEVLGRADATSEGWNPDDIWKFTDCQGDWWKLGTTQYIMWDGTQFANGWGPVASRRIQWFLDQYPVAGEAAEASPQSEKSIWLNLEVSSGVFNLLDKSFVIDSSPDYLPGKYDFTAKVFSTSEILLGEYGFNDPRRILAESDYAGPTWLDSVNFKLILPYFNSGSRVDLIESATGSVKLSIDISQFATNVVTNQPPVANPGGPYIKDEGSAITFDGSASSDPDAGDSIIRYEWDFDYDGVTFEVDASGAALTNPSYTYADGPASKKVALRVTDRHRAQNIATADVTVNNVAPTIDSLSADKYLTPINTAITGTGAFHDPGTLDTFTALWNWEDSSNSINLPAGSASTTDNHVYTIPGVYDVSLTVTDKDGGSDTKNMPQYIIVYDPSGGFVTGGGSIDSPKGAYAADPELTGKANFGFVSKYNKGAITPLGETEFQFHAGDFNFHSTSYDWLVVAGAKAQFKGTGIVNGAEGYEFLLTATDGQVSGGGGFDKFRIKIVDKTSNSVVYDNVIGASEDIDVANPQIIAQGSIVIHK